MHSLRSLAAPLASLQRFQLPYARRMAQTQAVTPTGAETWNKRYGEPDRYAYGEAPNAFIEEAAERYLKQQSLRIAELASGEGRNVVHLAKMGHHVSAVDFSSSGLDKTRQLATKAGLKHDPSLIDYHEADVVTWQPTQPVDVVVMSFCHIAKDDKPAFFANLLRMLKPGGLLLLETFHPDQIAKGYRAKSGGPPDPDMMYTIDELRGYLQGGEELEASHVEYELREGPLHNGIGSVTRYVWRKGHQ